MAVSVDVTSHIDEVKEAMHSQLQVALEIIGLKAEGYAKQYAPVGTPESTGIPGYIGGTLRNSISHTADDDSAYIGTNVEYAPYQEFGTSKMSAANGGKGYLKPAIMEHIDEYKADVENALKG